MQKSVYKAMMVVTITFAVLVAAVIGLQKLTVFVHEMHPRAVEQEMASWEPLYGKTPAARDFGRCVEMLGYVRNYYPYEDDPEYKGSELAESLAVQRERTLQAIATGLKEASGQDFGTDEKSWKEWYAKNGAKMK